jgi:hypothetical protein
MLSLSLTWRVLVMVVSSQRAQKTRLVQERSPLVSRCCPRGREVTSTLWQASSTHAGFGTSEHRVHLSEER